MASKVAPSVSTEFETDSGIRRCQSAVDLPQPDLIQKPCRGCKRGRRLPRNIAFIELEDVKPEQIRPALAPTTQHTVVCHCTHKASGEPSISSQVFQHLPVSYNVKASSIWSFLTTSVVEHFWYNRLDGNVKASFKENRASPEEQRDWEYARMISLPQWYLSLISVIGVVSLEILDTHANFLLIVNILYDQPVWMEDFPQSPYVLTVGYILLTICCFVCAVNAAKVEWTIKASPAVGDIHGSFDRPTQMSVFGAIVLFKYFAVECLVMDIVILLHPWKSVQPYAAFKTEGTRLYALGWQSKTMYEVENRRGQWNTMSMRLVQKSFIFFTKAWFATWLWFGPAENRALALYLSVLSSSGSLIWGWGKWNMLRKQRNMLRQYLLNVVESCSANQDSAHLDSDNDATRQTDTALRLLKQHFGISRSKTTLSDVRSQVMDGRCKCCGRGDASDKMQPKSDQDQTPRLHKGDRVRLDAKWSNEDRAQLFHDACYGPLAPGEVGIVKACGPWIAGVGHRFLVKAEKDADYRAVKGCSREWWYDEDALEVCEAAEPLSMFSSPSPSSAERQREEGDEEALQSLLADLRKTQGTKWLLKQLQGIKDWEPVDAS